MKECIYRIPVQQNSGGVGVDKAFNKAVTGKRGIVEAHVLGNLRQTFCDGLCQLLTQNDMGPMECRQPNQDEKTCPDIASYRKQILQKQL